MPERERVEVTPVARGPAARVHVALGAALVIALVIAAFSPAFSGRLLDWDDHVTLVHNPRFRGFTAENVSWMFSTSYLGPYQPLSWMSLALDHELFGLGPGFDPPESAGYHATNIVLHALAALACLFAALRTFELTAPRADPRWRAWAATLAAALFAIHPLRVESVAWVTERRDVLSGLFFMLALNLWLRSTAPGADAIVARGRAWLGAALALASSALFFASVDLHESGTLAWRALGPAGLSAALVALGGGAWLVAGSLRSRTTRASRVGYVATVALLLLALGAKGTSMVLPALLVVFDAWPLRRVTRSSLAALALEKLPLFAAAIPFVALAMWGQRSLGTDTLLDWEAHTLGERCVQACYSLAHYSWRTLAPVGLLPIYDLPEQLRASEPRFAIAIAGALAVTAIALALRRRFPALLAAWIAFAIAIAPVSGLTQAGPQLAADRYSYLSTWPFAWLAAGAWLAWSARPSQRALAVLAAVLATLVLGALTLRHTRVWHDSESLWTYTLERSPQSAIAHAQLAGCRSRAASDASAPEQRRALFLEAERLFARAIELDPTPNIMHLRDWGTTLVQVERGADAIAPLKRYLEARALDPDARMSLGAALRLVGRNAEAVAQLEAAVELAPQNGKAWTQLGLAREAAGNRAGAIEAFERVAQMWPKHAPTRTKLEQLRAAP